MSYPSTQQAKVYCVHEHPFAYATLTDFGEGKGLLQIYSDWGTYAFFWGSMGGPIREFLLGTSPSYIETKLRYNIQNLLKKDSEIRLTKFMAQCWPRLLEEFKKDTANVCEEVADGGVPKAP